LKKFLKTVAIVTVFSTCEKFLGFLYRIFLSRSIGAEGIGVYQVALSVFALLLTLCCSGTPITVSRLMTKYRAENDNHKARKVISAGILFTLFSALLICFIFFIFRSKLTFIFTDKRAEKVFYVVLPGLIFTSVYSVLRGVFWGDKDFLPYSVIELLEEICMIVVGISLISFTSDIFKGTFSAGVAVLISYIFSFTLATIVSFFRKNKIVSPKGQLKPLLCSAMPITAMRTANSFSNSLVSVILPMRLVAAGYTNAEAMSAFGSALGQAIPLLYIPTSLIGSFTLVLVPEISENFYTKKYYYLKRDVEKAIKFTVFLTCLFIPVFTVCGVEIGIVVFGGHSAGEFLSYSAFVMLFMSLSGITTSILNSVGLEHKTLIYCIISGFLMLLSIFFLPKYMGIYSLIIGLLFLHGLTTILNLLLLKKSCAIKPNYLKFTLYSIGFCLPTTLLGFMIERLLLSCLGTFLTLAICTVIMIIFNTLLYFGFNLITIDFIKKKFFTKKVCEKQKPQAIACGQKSV
jgi:stage V sporulation protein B